MNIYTTDKIRNVVLLGHGRGDYVLYGYVYISVGGSPPPDWCVVGIGGVVWSHPCGVWCDAAMVGCAAMCGGGIYIPHYLKQQKDMLTKETPQFIKYPNTS